MLWPEPSNLLAKTEGAMAWATGLNDGLEDKLKVDLNGTYLLVGEKEDDDDDEDDD
jgi:hypothetical protein